MSYHLMLKPGTKMLKPDACPCCGDADHLYTGHLMFLTMGVECWSCGLKMGCEILDYDNPNFLDLRKFVKRHSLPIIRATKKNSDHLVGGKWLKAQDKLYQYLAIYKWNRRSVGL